VSGSAETPNTRHYQISLKVEPNSQSDTDKDEAEAATFKCRPSVLSPDDFEACYIEGYEKNHSFPEAIQKELEDKQDAFNIPELALPQTVEEVKNLKKEQLRYLLFSLIRNRHGTALPLEVRVSLHQAFYSKLKIQLLRRHLSEDEISEASDDIIADYLHWYSKVVPRWSSLDNKSQNLFMERWNKNLLFYNKDETICTKTLTSKRHFDLSTFDTSSTNKFKTYFSGLQKERCEQVLAYYRTNSDAFNKLTSELKLVLKYRAEFFNLSPLECTIPEETIVRLQYFARV